MIVDHVSLYRTCTNVDVVYICTYMYVYVHGCVISLYLLYSTLLYCVHLNDSAVNYVKDVKDVNNEHRSPFSYLSSFTSFTIPILHER